ncbi:Rz1 family lipoprotein [Enterobacter mori]|nr:Rz1 family lipoprotein [Enterobacter mori]MCO7361032.1 Rz1 family lipoprotein [Enterobacter mori]
MRNLSLKICSVALALVGVGCTSTPDVQRTERPAPPAWMMQPAPDLLTPLSGIISPSERESSQSPNN